MSCSTVTRLLLAAAAAGSLTGCTFLMAVKGPPTTPPALDPDLVQRGAMLFNDPKLSGDGSRACATCHPGGGSDMKVYLDGSPVAPGTPGGWRTLSLRGAWQTAPYLWDNSATTLAQAVDRMFAVEMRGGKLAGREREALEAYVLSLAPFDRGRLQPDGTPNEPVSLAARRGFAVAQDACLGCHKPPAYARLLRYDVGTGGAFAVPTLRGVSAGGPYGHDGRWPDLATCIRAIAAAKEITLTDDQLSQLLEYLKLL
ncbi:MAG TPA: cytochrome c peroxidase [Myxococcota bacterium]|nr:cytochrome c peroxidase [Myxococcota bacterium]